jgi:hypothetical protein
MTAWVNQAVEQCLRETALQPQPETERKDTVMNTSVTDRNSPPAPAETFIIAPSEEGYRVCSPLNPAKQFTVTGIPDDPQCTCPDFTHPDRPPHGQSKHSLAVLTEAGETTANRVNGTPLPGGSRGSDKPPTRTAKRAGNGRNGSGAVMLLKRSVSPDGHIDSLSVEFSCPVGAVTTTAIKQQAATILALQGEITAGFLKTNGNGSTGQVPDNGNDAPNAVPAQLLNLGSLNGKWGRRLFINVLVNGQIPSKLFGTQQELAGALAAAGYPNFAGASNPTNLAAQMNEGVQLNLPCRVITKPSKDGKYINVERVLPAQAAGPSRG